MALRAEGRHRDRPQGKDPDAIQLAAIDAGAEDVEVEPGLATVYTTPTSFERVKKGARVGGNQDRRGGALDASDHHRAR